MSAPKGGLALGEMGKLLGKLRPAATELPNSARILIVDDQRFDRARLIRLIDELDFETHVVQADSLETMRAKLKTDRFDLIFVDYNLPDGTGLQALDAILLNARNCRAATIMIAGEGQDEIAIEALKRGCSDCINKDDLTSSSFHRASINALQKARLTEEIEVQKARYLHLEAILEALSSKSTKEIKPVVSRLALQIRDLREASDSTSDQSAERYDRMDRACARIRAFLDELSRRPDTAMKPEAVSKSAAPITRDADASASPPAAGKSRTAPAHPRRVEAAPTNTDPAKKMPRPRLFGKFKK